MSIKLISKSQLFLKRNAPTILTCIGGVGVVITAVMAVKTTPKALTLLEEAKEEKGEALTELEVVKTVAPSYIPTMLMGAATITCIFGANILNKRQQASLASAYALLSTSYKEYKDKVKEMLGEDANEQIGNEIAKDHYKEIDISDEEDGLELFYDNFSGRYFRSTMYKVQRAEYALNRELFMRDYVYLNEFYEMLDLEPVDAGYSLGWSKGLNLAAYWQEWVDFSHSKVVMDDGLECHVIYMMAEPMLDFMDYS